MNKECIDEGSVRKRPVDSESYRDKGLVVAAMIDTETAVHCLRAVPLQALNARENRVRILTWEFGRAPSFLSPSPRSMQSLRRPPVVRQ